MDYNYHEYDAEIQWDAHRAFHKQYGVNRYACAHSAADYRVGVFTLFVTGELRCNQNTPKPALRRHYTDLGVDLLATNDPDWAFYTEDGRPLSKACLARGGGQQYLLRDSATERAVSLGRWRRDPSRPLHLHGASAWAHNPKAQLVGADPVREYRRDPEAEAEVKEALETVRNEVMMWVMLENPGLEEDINGYWLGRHRIHVNSLSGDHPIRLLVRDTSDPREAVGEAVRQFQSRLSTPNPRYWVGMFALLFRMETNLLWQQYTPVDHDAIIAVRP